MKMIPLTRGMTAKVDDEDFGWLATFRWYADIVSDRFYAATSDSSSPRPVRRPIRMHRLILGAASGQHVDHANGDTLDNRRCNLRFCTETQNNGNRGASSTNKTGFVGVYRTRSGSYAAQITVARRTVFIGAYTNAIDAAKARDQAALAFRGPFARLNFPQG